MIRADKLTKIFDGYAALQDVDLEIREGEVFGLVGTNGAGKSTFFRLAAGILRPDSGTIRVDDEPAWDNTKTKAMLSFVSDDPYAFPNSTPSDMERYYRSIYSKFDTDRFRRLLKNFDLDPKRKIADFSKGMKKQLAILLAVSSGTKYLLLDETFDGLDPVMRQAVKSLFAEEMDRRGLTPVIASHNLRELEDICEHVGFLHRGGLILSEDVNEMKLDILKVQCVFREEADAQKVLSSLKVIQMEKQGRLYMLTVRGTKEEIMHTFNGADMVFFEILPLTLEEVFIAESEGAGYDVRKLIIH